MQQEQRGRWVYIPDPEEIPVTFQIGMVGEDGVLLASDRAIVRQGALPRTTSSCVKLHINPSRTMAYCCAGDDFTQIFADAVFTSEKPDDMEIKEFILSRTTAAFRKASGAWATGGSILVAYTYKTSVELVRICLPNTESPHVWEPIKTRDFQGDGTNTAAFFIQRYMSVRGYRKRRVEELKPIVAHTILMASEINSEGISDLDIALCRPGQPFEMLGTEEIARLTAESLKIDSQIADLLGIPRPDRKRTFQTLPA